MLVRFPWLIVLLDLSIFLIFCPLVLLIVEVGGANVSNYNCWICLVLLEFLSVLILCICFWNLLLGTFVFRLLYPIDESCQENPMDRGAWQAIVHGVAKSWTRLSNWTHRLHLGFFFLCHELKILSAMRACYVASVVSDSATHGW